MKWLTRCEGVKQSNLNNRKFWVFTKRWYVEAWQILEGYGMLESECFKRFTIPSHSIIRYLNDTLINSVRSNPQNFQKMYFDFFFNTNLNWANIVLPNSDIPTIGRIETFTSIVKFNNTWIIVLLYYFIKQLATYD